MPNARIQLRAVSQYGEAVSRSRLLTRSHNDAPPAPGGCSVSSGGELERRMNPALSWNRNQTFIAQTLAPHDELTRRR
jgi:hypothetical protein